MSSQVIRNQLRFLGTGNFMVGKAFYLPIILPSVVCMYAYVSMYGYAFKIHISFVCMCITYEAIPTAGLTINVITVLKITKDIHTQIYVHIRILNRNWSTICITPNTANKICTYMLNRTFELTPEIMKFDKIRSLGPNYILQILIWQNDSTW